MIDLLSWLCLAILWGVLILFGWPNPEPGLLGGVLLLASLCIRCIIGLLATVLFLSAKLMFG